ncbi:DMT family transporter [Cyanobium sp. WAJ14-Wanaka]|uniref:DMT family transporter n=1 Tax=Cyanobium sp. WAJ14-Wanaka TaxID=2823725 RepID=UPI0020CCECD1|nr:DMT family transporter [Cyanobium sp. WAJ14-Wanaka]MCP9775990.1 EamA family transporter [Cyanobium sp. WAJ14-Wanaka]
MNRQHQGLLRGLLAAVTFGLSAPLISTLTASGSPLSIAGLLYGGSALVLLAARSVLGKSNQESSVKRQDLGMLAMLTLIGGIAAPICLVSSLALLSAGSASLLLNLEAIFTMGIAIVVGREHLSSKGITAAVLILAGAVIIGGGTTTGPTLYGAVLIALACLGWGIDNNISQRLSIRDPIQVALLKSVGAAVPMLIVAGMAGARFPTPIETALFLVIGGIGYGLSIWLDLLALRELGAARESVIFATAPFVGAGFSVVVLKETMGSNLLAAGALMVGGIALLLLEDHAHWHRHSEEWHEHKHCHSPIDQDPHHAHEHPNGETDDTKQDQPLWHSHTHKHEPITHAHPHASDDHHRHQH